MGKLIDLLKRYDYWLVLLVLVAASVVLMVQTTHYQRSRMVRWSLAISGVYYNTVNTITDYFGLKEENARLAAENARLRAQMEESYISYIDTMFTVDDTVYHQRYSYTEASVIKNSWSQQDNYILIGKGSRHGVEADMAVISPDGIVGVVVATTENFASVMSVLHSDSRNSVRLGRTGVGGSLVWDGHDYRHAQVVDVPTTHPFEVGDTIITSGLAADFPEGIPVGYVEGADTIRGTGFYSLHIRLATDFNKLKHVYVINNKFRNEQQKLEQL